LGKRFIVVVREMPSPLIDMFQLRAHGFSTRDNGIQMSWLGQKLYLLFQAMNRIG